MRFLGIQFLRFSLFLAVKAFHFHQAYTVAFLMCVLLTTGTIDTRGKEEFCCKIHLENMLQITVPSWRLIMLCITKDSRHPAEMKCMISIEHV